MESSTEVPQKIKNELLYDPVIPFLDIYLKQTKTLSQKDLCTPMFVAALFTIAKTWKQPECSSVDEWIKKMWCICTVKYFSGTKKKEFLPFLTIWVDLKGIMLSEKIRQRKTNNVWSHLYVVSKIKKKKNS